MSGTVLTPQFVVDLTTNITHIVENEYANVAANLWWSKVAKLRTSKSAKEDINWLMSSASLDKYGSAPKVVYDELTFLRTSYEPEYAGKGLKLKRADFEDLDGRGIESATAWAAQQGQLMAYHPQRLIGELLRGGTASTCYDGQNYFSTAHPYHLYDSGKGTYANLFTSTASGNYPGVCRLDAGVSLEDAFLALSKAIAYIEEITMPDGITPRNLRPVCLLVPPKMHVRAVQLSNSKLFPIGVANGTGGGSADMAAVIDSWGLAPPIKAPELRSQTGYTSGDTTAYLVCKEANSTALGGLVYVEREPFQIVSYTGLNGQNVELGRTQELEWLVNGRNVGGYGHPFAIFALPAT
jgi:phage major head subunit gpT-like protein